MIKRGKTLKEGKIMKRKHTVLKGFAVVSTALLLTLSGVGNFSPIESSTNGTQKVASNVKVDTSTNGFAQTDRKSVV